jgi:sn-glycerol 3-phosphate transport system permease protein
MEDNIRFERLWTRAVLIFVIAFSVFFIVAERDGLARLIAWAWNGVVAAPQALQNVIAYYGALTPVQLFGSLGIGALFGILITLFVLYRSAKPPTFSPRLIGLSLLVGGVGGALGSQLLNLPLQHCTYTPEIDGIQQVLGVFVTLGSTLFVLFPVWTILTRRSVISNHSTAGYFRSPVLPYLFLAPTLLSLLLFLYYPGLQTITLSLNLKRFPLPQERFICLNNYASLFQDTIYQNSFITSLLMTVAVVIISMAIALGIAVLASQKIRGASFYRTLLIWPFALSPVVVGTIFLAMFREGSSGLANYMLERTFGVSLSWLRDPALAPWVIVFASVWNIMGFNILFYIAGLQNVPADLLEAAQIDGANRPQRFAWITFPLLAPFTFFLLVTNVTYSFYGIYGAIDTLTQGGPPLGAGGALGGATNVLIYKLYEYAFNPGSPAGLAAAQALVLFMVVAGITLLQFRYIEQRITYSE